MSSASAPSASTAWAEQIEALAGGGVAGLPAPLSIGPARSAEFFASMAETVAQLLPEFATGSVKIVKRGELETGNILKPFQADTKRYDRHAYVGGFPSDRIDNVQVMAADLRIICGADRLPVAVTAADGVEIDQKEYAIVRVTAIPAAGAPVLYILQARAA